MLIKDPSASPWLTIVVPVFNVKEYLEACLRSIASGLEPGVELIAVEDCSTDGSAAELHRLAGELPLRIIQHDRNRGLSCARNTGLEAARGTYVWFLDSDDLIQPNAIQVLRQIVERHAPDIVMCDFRMFRQHMRLKHRLRGELHRRTFDGPSRTLGTDVGTLIAGVFSSGHLHTWSKIARLTLWGDDLRFPPGRYFEDARTTPALLSRARSWYHVPEPWVSYRQREGSILNQMDLRKIDDLTSAFDGWRLMPDASAETRFGVAFHMTRAFMGACKLLVRRSDGLEVDALMHVNRSRYLANSPMTARQMVMAFLRKGWLWRAVRLTYWLRRSAKAPG